MDWLQPVDIYCERTGPGFWAEPWNALSNAGFVAAAFWAGWAAWRRHLRTPVLWLLIVLAAMIGAGSFLFHTFANRWSELADVIPIWSFVAIYLLASITWIAGSGPGRIGIAAVTVAAAVVVVTLAAGEGGGTAGTAPDAARRLNGSLQYAPALAALAGFSVLTAIRRHPFRYWVWGATAAFFVSLLFRTIDPDICAAFPTGTHFIWHLMNGAMIAALLQLAVRLKADLHV